MNPIDPNWLGGQWLKGDGDESDVVVSTRIRLARNLKHFPFMPQATLEQKAEISEIIRGTLMKGLFADEGRFLAMSDLEEVDQLYLIERHLISRELAGGQGPSGVAFMPTETLSVMVNEEDHLRGQVILSGFETDRAWERMASASETLGKELDFAFSPQFGYLTACPTNVGTGMRASVMLHLPALVMSQQIDKVFQAVSKINLAVRGLYGEGTQASGDFYQISNQVTLGVSEPGILDNLKRVVPKITQYERNVREHLGKKNRITLEDKVYRALGLLRNARSVSSEEAVDLLSALRLGVNVGLVEDVPLEKANELFVIVHPGHLQKLAGRSLTPGERDVARARLLRERLS